LVDVLVVYRQMDIYTNSAISLLPFRNNLCFNAIDMDSMRTLNRDLLKNIMIEVSEKIRDGHYKVSKLV